MSFIGVTRRVGTENEASLDYEARTSRVVECCCSGVNEVCE